MKPQAVGVNVGPSHATQFTPAEARSSGEAVDEGPHARGSLSVLAAPLVALLRGDSEPLGLFGGQGPPDVPTVGLLVRRPKRLERIASKAARSHAPARELSQGAVASIQGSRPEPRSPESVDPRCRLGRIEFRQRPRPYGLQVRP